MQTSEQLNELATALAKAQGEIENAHKNSNNPHFRSKYADLAEVLNTIRPVFSKHGLSLVQSPSFDANTGLVSVTTMLMHTSGQWIRDTASAPATKMDAQGVGSCVTYLRRYAGAAFGAIAQEDDDGNAASQPKVERPKPPTEAELAKGMGILQASANLNELKAAFKSLRPEVQVALTELKDSLKEQLS